MTCLFSFLWAAVTIVSVEKPFCHELAWRCVG